jgi:hypothetical protein
LITCLRHEGVKDAKCDRRDCGKEEKASVVTKVMHDGAGDDLTERSANADRRTDGPEGEIKAARALREVGDHEDRDNAEYSRRHTIKNLDRDQRYRVVGECVENGANWQGPKRDQRRGFLPHDPALRPDHEASTVTTSCVVTTHADINSIELRPLPLASISPRSGSIAAFAK